MLSKDRSKTTSGFFVIPLFGQLWEEKNYCERRNEFSSWRPVTSTNRHIHLCLSKLGYDVHALLSSVMYILSGENLTAVYSIIRLRWDQNTTQVANRLNWAQATYVWLLHLTPCVYQPWKSLFYLSFEVKKIRENSTIFHVYWHACFFMVVLNRLGWIGGEGGVALQLKSI